MRQLHLISPVSHTSRRKGRAVLEAHNKRANHATAGRGIKAIDWQ